MEKEGKLTPEASLAELLMEPPTVFWYGGGDGCCCGTWLFIDLICTVGGKDAIGHHDLGGFFLYSNIHKILLHKKEKATGQCGQTER